MKNVQKELYFRCAFSLPPFLVTNVYLLSSIPRCAIIPEFKKICTEEELIHDINSQMLEFC